MQVMGLWALPVATMTAQLGFRPLYLHLMFMNFSNPMSAPKPACKHPGHQLNPLLTSTLVRAQPVLQDG